MKGSKLFIPVVKSITRNIAHYVWIVHCLSVRPFSGNTFFQEKQLDWTNIILAISYRAKLKWLYPFGYTQIIHAYRDTKGNSPCIIFG